MPYSTAAITIVGVLCLVNIVLTLGVIRRLGAPGAAPGPAAEPAALRVKPGTRVGDFAVPEYGGGELSRAGLSGTTLVAFMAPGCPLCEENLEEFIARAKAVPGGRDQVVAVILGASAGAGELCEQLTPVARVLIERAEMGPLVTAFGVGALPAYGLLSGDTLVASYPLPSRIPDIAPA